MTPTETTTIKKLARAAAQDETLLLKEQIREMVARIGALEWMVKYLEGLAGVESHENTGKDGE